MINLKDFLEKTINIKRNNESEIYIYDGDLSLIDASIVIGGTNGLLSVYKSEKKPEYIFKEEVLKRNIKWIIRTDYGLAVVLE